MTECLFVGTTNWSDKACKFFRFILWFWQRERERVLVIRLLCGYSNQRRKGLAPISVRASKCVWCSSSKSPQCSNEICHTLSCLFEHTLAVVYATERESEHAENRLLLRLDFQCDGAMAHRVWERPEHTVNSAASERLSCSFRTGL